ncbi:hypothetical protein EMIT0196MI5_130131 [Pseudomonas sp. IT-196MI5]
MPISRICSRQIHRSQFSLVSESGEEFYVEVTLLPVRLVHKRQPSNQVDTSTSLRLTK